MPENEAGGGCVFFNWLNFVVRIAAGDEESAAYFFDNLVRQAVLVYRLLQQPRETGKMGGHPVNRHKEEALLLAKNTTQITPTSLKPDWSSWSLVI